MTRRRLGIMAVLVGGVASLGGCRAAAWSSLYTANAIACLGSYQRTADLRYGPHRRNRLDVYRPLGRYLANNPDPPPPTGVWSTANLQRIADAPAHRSSARRGRPVVVFFHGGDWSDGYPGKSLHRFIGDALTSRGFVAVVVNYRRYPQVKFPLFVDDGARAVAWVHHHIARYGGDPDRIFVMGHSAGAHIAAMVAVNGRYLKKFGGRPGWIKGMIGMAGPYSFLPIPPDHPLLKKIFGPPAHYPLSQPVNYVDAHDPPMLLLRGNKDQRVPAQCMNRMAARVHQVRGQVVTITYPDLSHIMLLGSLATPVRWNQPVLDDIAAFIRCIDAQDALALPPPASTVKMANSGQPPPPGAEDQAKPAAAEGPHG